MFLLIDTSVFDQIALTFFGDNAVARKEYTAKNRELLACIEQGFLDVGCAPKDLRGIAVVVGVGSFTNTRIAVTVANTFGYALHIPLLAVTEEMAKDFNQLGQMFKEVVPGNYISATYSAEASISTPRPRG